MSNNIKSRIISITYPESEYPDDLVMLFIPEDVCDERIKTEIVFWSDVVKRVNKPETKQDFADALLNAICNMWQGAHWRYVEPFATINVDELY